MNKLIQPLLLSILLLTGYQSLANKNTTKQLYSNNSSEATNPATHQSDSTKEITISAPIVLDYNLVDFPMTAQSISVGGFSGIFSNPSMSQSLGATSSLYSLTREGYYRFAQRMKFSDQLYILSAATMDVLLYLPMPLTSGWLHEEYHRSTMLKHGYSSFNDMNRFKISETVIAVSQVDDVDLISLKKDSPQDMARMSVAGIEGEYMLASEINKSLFFHKSKAYTVTPLLSTLNSIFYVIICSDEDLTIPTSMWEAEWDDVSKRDLVGYDFLAWTYDMHRPFEPYEQRGEHPSGIGVNRYISHNDLTSEELRYLKKQGNMQLLNLLNPALFGIKSITLKKDSLKGTVRGNFYINHILTGFGYDLSATALLDVYDQKLWFTLHNYVNHNHWSPGIEAGVFERLIKVKQFRKPLMVTGSIGSWLQPKQQLYNDEGVKLGGYLKGNIFIPVGKKLYPYISFTTKTDGWLMGNEYLNGKINAGFGLRTYL